MGMQSLREAENAEQEARGWELISTSAEAGDIMAKAWLDDRAGRPAQGEYDRFARGIMSQFVKKDLRSARDWFRGCSTEPARAHVDMMRHVCQTCSKKNDGKLLECAKCSGPRYCNRVCQQADWPNHKKFCNRKK